jgi:hypothetical protein
MQSIYQDKQCRLQRSEWKFHSGGNASSEQLDRRQSAEAVPLLDETRTADQAKSGQAPPILQLVMRLAGGQVRGRMTDDRPPLRFETPLLSLSNESLDEMAEKSRTEIDDAHRGRLIAGRSWSPKFGGKGGIRPSPRVVKAHPLLWSAPSGTTVSARRF